MSPLPRYAALGALISSARVASGMTQAALARVLGLKQQSVSRWEAGTHRPAIDQMGPLAGALNVDEQRLVQLAQADPSPVLTIAPLLPLNQLPPEMFERFVGYVADQLFPAAKVRLQGARGHDQGGWDVLVESGTETIGIQCKRVERFGPAEARRVIEAVDKVADRCILAISRVVSPAAADEFKEAGWEIWDQDDISRMVRQLPGEQQDKLVDIYFRGQRLALLGRDNPGPWVKLERFFAPFDRTGGAFTHQWPLLGRDEDVCQLTAALEGEESVTILSAPGGFGKSRLIKAGVSGFVEQHPDMLVRFLSPVGEPDQASLEALGGGPKLLVVDDAHDRDGLPVLIQYAADPANKARLLLVTRPYAEQRIRNDLARFAIFKPATVVLNVLPKPAMQELIRQALADFDADKGWENVILRVAADNPLIAVMAARVVSDQPLPLELIRGADDMRKVILERFTNVLTGRIGSPEDSRLLRDMLGLIAMLQPVRIDDRQIGALLEAVTPHAAADATRALRLLIDGGILYKRGRTYRLMPDLLGDYLIDDLCIQTDDRLSLFAERVLQNVDERLLPKVMVNLGRLDWRRHDGDPSDSDLLAVAWARFRDIESEWDLRLDAVRAVAIYQPAQALRFVSDRLRTGKDFRSAAKILENIAYTERYRGDALRLLWEMGRGDGRETGANPAHPIRILAELCEFGEHKPFEFSEEIVEFALALMNDPAEWQHPHTPLEIVAPILKGTIDKSRSTGRAIVFESAFVRYEYAQPLRAAIIGRILGLLEHPSPRVAATAARYLEDTLRIPYGIGGATPPQGARRLYDREFVATMDAVAKRIARNALSSTTLLAVAGAVSWHADYAKGPTGAAAERLLAKLPTDLHFRLRAAMVDRARFAFRGQVTREDWEDDIDSWLPALIAEIGAAWPEPNALLDEIETALRDLANAGLSDGSAYMLLNALVAANLPLAYALLARAGNDPGSPFRGFVWAAMAPVLGEEPARGRDLIARYLERDADMAARALPAVGSLRRPIAEADLALLRLGLMSDEVGVARAALSALHWLKDLPEGQVKALLLLTPIERHPELLGDLAMHFAERRRALVSLLDSREVEGLLARMRDIPSFEGHWVVSLLKAFAREFPEPFADFLFERTDRALAEEDSGIDLLGYGYHEGRLGFHESPRVADILDRAWSWVRGHDGAQGYDVYRVAELFAGMFDIDADVVVEFLDAKLDRATPVELGWIAKVVRHTHHEFPFRQQRFVERFLDRCAAAGSDVVKRAVENLVSSAVSGMKSGTLGEPMPRDLKARDAATSVLRALPRLSPAYPLYEAILRDAERDIAEAVREGRDLDAEEDE